jgi:hypothetical protein
MSHQVGPGFSTVTLDHKRSEKFSTIFDDFLCLRFNLRSAYNAQYQTLLDSIQDTELMRSQTAFAEWAKEFHQGPDMDDARIAMAVISLDPNGRVHIPAAATRWWTQVSTLPAITLLQACDQLEKALPMHHGYNTGIGAIHHLRGCCDWSVAELHLSHKSHFEILTFKSDALKALVTGCSEKLQALWTMYQEASAYPGPFTVNRTESDPVANMRILFNKILALQNHSATRDVEPASSDTWISSDSRTDPDPATRSSLSGTEGTGSGNALRPTTLQSCRDPQTVYTTIHLGQSRTGITRETSEDGRTFNSTVPVTTVEEGPSISQMRPRISRFARSVSRLRRTAWGKAKSIVRR